MVLEPSLDNRVADCIYELLLALILCPNIIFSKSNFSLMIFLKQNRF